MSEVWWTLKQASEATGLHPETLRQWASRRPSRVRSRRRAHGRRSIWEVAADDVLHEAELSNGRKNQQVSDVQPAPRRLTGSSSLDLLVTLEEVARRYRIIDELRGEIEERHLQIEKHQREIAVLLQAPTQVPNN